jgi:hypothetical protein
MTENHVPYLVDGRTLDSVELKALIVSRGVKVSNEVYERFAGTSRLSRNPLECNTTLLPDGTVVQLTDLAFHMSYINQAMSWGALRQLRYMSQLRTPFRLALDERSDPAIFHNEEKVTQVGFPPPTDFYRQRTSTGIPFLANAVLQGTQWLSFQSLWKCDYACAGQPCQYCYSGGELHSIARRKKPLPRYPAPDDVAEIVEYAVCVERCADSIQITGGSTFDVREEYRGIADILRAMDERVGRENISGEVLIYVTAPDEPNLVEELFASGADRLSISLEIWDENLARKIMPGKMKYTGRQRHLDALTYIAEKYGKNKACSNFIVGLEPAESMLEGAEYLAAKGIVPIASVWIPFGRPVLGSMKAPQFDYYQRVKIGLERIYERYGIVPPGGSGLNVCMCRDVYLGRRVPRPQ